MIQINDVNKVKETPASKVKKKTSGGSFSAYLQDVLQPSAESVSGTVSVSAADAIFAAQAAGDDEERELRKKQLSRGNSLLEKLEEIRDGLLRGYIAKERLIEIARLVREKKFTAQDERLNQIIDEIELRVEVELAKLMK